MTRYTTSQTVTAPAAGTYDIGAWGGGAGGINTQSGSGGGGGAFSYASVVVAAGDQLVLTIPNAASAGANGGQVTVVRNSVTLCSANGGTGVTGGTTGGVGSTKFAGGNGGGGDSYFDGEFGVTYYAKGGGGGSAGRGGAGGGGGTGTADFGDVVDGGGGNGNVSYTGTEWDGAAGGGGGVAGNQPGGGGGGAAGGGKGAVELIFTASDAAPVITPATTAFNVLENAAFSQDFDADQAVTWSLVGGTDQGQFSINSAGLLSMAAKDFDAPGDSNGDNVYQVTLRATNTGGANLFTNKTVTVTVLNDTAAPTISPATAAFNVNSGAAFSQDFNSNQAGTTWSIVGGADAAQFSIDSNGLLSMAAKDVNSPADVGGNNVYDVTFRATGPEGVTTDKAVTVTVIAPEYFPSANSSDAVGNRPWSNLQNLYADDELFAQSTTIQANQTSYTATLSGFDLSAVPDTAQMLGVELITELDGSSGSGTVTGVLNFTLKSGASSTKSTPNYGRDIAEATHTLGGPTDMWGLSGADLTGVGFKSSFNVTMRAVASASGSGSGNPRIDYVKIRLYYLTAVALTPNNLATSAPAMGSPAIGQAHALGATNVATSAPQITSAAVGQRHALTPQAVATAAPAISAPALGQRHSLTPSNVSTSAPAISTTVALGQRHALTPTNVSTAAPAISTPVLTRVVALSPTNLTTAAPVIQSAAIGQRHGLGATSLTTGPPAFSSPALGLGSYGFTPVSLATAAPAISSPAIGQRHALTPTAFATSSPQITSPAVGQRQSLTPAGIATSAPEIFAAPLAQRHALTPTAFATAAPAIASGVLGVLATELMFARPVEIGSAIGWTDQAGGGAILAAIDDVVPDDADWAGSPPDPVDSVLRVRLGVLANSALRDIKLRYRLGRLGGAATAQTVRLYQGGGSTIGAGTLIGGPYAHSVANLTTFEQSISAAAISNPNDLWVEVEAG